MTTPSQSSISTAKRAAGKKAADLIESGMSIGLGTGSTTAAFIEALIEKCQRGLKIRAVASSERSHNQAIRGGISMLDVDEVTMLDLTVDGADEIDSHKRMIKGGGGALLREKIIASISQEMVVIVDESKCVSLLGKFPLPVEIAPFAYRATIHALNGKGYKGKLRLADKTPYRTDSGHFIFDVAFDALIDNPEYHEAVIRGIPGVMTTGFFFNLAGRIVVGGYDGSVKILP